MAKHRSDFIISWTTITYRSVATFFFSLALLGAVVMYFMFPDTTKKGMERAGNYFARVMEALGLLEGTGAQVAPGQQQAQFTYLDGSVRVKKVSSNQWVNATYTLPLEKGDVVQTSSAGMAKVVFADGTNYTIKQDSLIVIEENSRTSDAQTQVAVQVTTGTVDLMTANFGAGSWSQVVVAGARATLAPETSAMVQNDPRAQRSEILVKSGAGQVERNGEVVALGNFEKVSFRAGEGAMVKSKELRPPTLIAPANMTPIFGASPIDFTWSPVDTSRAYRIRISRNPYFSSLVFDRRVGATELRVASLPEGAYYWLVQAIDASNRESLESEKNRFTVIPKSTSAVALPLELEPFIQHGHVLEVRGKTEARARVMVNGAEVPVVSDDGSFSYFTPALPTGENVITVTAQNTKGGVNTQQKKVVIQ